jgi:hypothetical protein
MEAVPGNRIIGAGRRYQRKHAENNQVPPPSA